MLTEEQHRRLGNVKDVLLAKWRHPTGKELIREGARIVTHLIERGPLPADRADSWLPTPEDRARGMIRYFADRDYPLEVNAAGDIVGAGLSLIADQTSARHLSHIHGRKYYNWCACDIVMFPIVLGIESPSSSIDPITGEQISFTTTPDGFKDVSHPDAWFTLAPVHGPMNDPRIEPHGLSCRQVYCDRVNIYRDRSTAEAVIAADSDLAAAPLDELWNDSKALATLF
ncbi:organomercurial lyase [Nocardia sp. NPDC050712]|uniref:organomercurial lyase n=1 Tax=Nocardia sp. NPDC050712 TaxID=3155518 RepID=UPI00341188B0